MAQLFFGKRSKQRKMSSLLKYKMKVGLADDTEMECHNQCIAGNWKEVTREKKNEMMNRNQ